MKEKKMYVLIGIVIFFVIILSFFIVRDNKVTDDEKNFKIEYEKNNGKTSLTSGKDYIKLDIPDKNGIKYIDSEQVIDILSEGSGIIYFGFPECPWCRNMIIPFLDVMMEEEETVYYYNAYSIRDEKYLDDKGNIKVATEGSDNYYKILELFGDDADIYDGLDDDSIKRLYFPTVVFVNNGEIVYKHVSTVDSQKDPYKKLSNKQVKELMDIYRNGLEKMRIDNTGEICTGKDSC